MKLSERLIAEREFVEKSLGDAVICERCGVTLATYTDGGCTAELSDPCPGFSAVEAARKKFNAEKN